MTQFDSSSLAGIEFDEYPTFEFHWPRIEDFTAGKPKPASWLLQICKDAGEERYAEPEHYAVPEPTPEPQPALPFEVFHTQPFNASAAWEAIRALSRGV